LEEGFRLSQDVAAANSREDRAFGFDFLVINAAILYAEKCALIANKTRPQDFLQRALLAEFLKFEFCTDFEKPAALDVRDWLKDARTVKSADHDFFGRGPKLVTRLKRAIRSRTSREHRAFK